MIKLPSTFRGLLFSPRGLSARGQRIATDMFKFRFLLRQDLQVALRDWRIGTAFPRLRDFPSAASYRELLAEVQALQAPDPGVFGTLVVKEGDYLRQAQTSRVTKDGVIDISLEDAFDQTLSGVSSLSTGSNNTFDASNVGATTFLETLKFESLVKVYLAMDMSWWPYNEGIIPLTEKNILTETALIDANTIVNEAVKFNPDLKAVVGYTHSYGNLGRAAALSTFDAVTIPEARTIMLAPLGIDLDIAVLLEVKNRFLGKVSTVRPAFDGLEELLSVHQTLMLQDVTYDQLVTDLRLGTSSHRLTAIADALQQELQKRGIDSVKLNEQFYTTRPGEVFYIREPDGTLDVQIKPRSGEQYSMETYLAQYEQVAEKDKAALSDVLDTQAKQLEVVVKYASASPELESLAQSLKDAKASLSAATSETLPSVLRDVNTTMVTISESLNAQIATATKNAQDARDSQWEDDIKSLSTQLDEFSRNAEETHTELENLDAGKYDLEDPVKV